MAASGLTEDCRCGYCLQDFNSMIEPRELACHHVFCLSCLQGDFRDGREVICLICNKRYETLSFEDLPKATLSNKAYEEVVICDRKRCEATAVSYCVECEERFCEAHQQRHSEYFEDCHKVIPIRNYAEQRKDVRKPKCQHHDEVLGQACKVCDKLFCVFCDPKENCRDADPHDFHRFDDLEAEITAHYTKLQEPMRAKLTEICKMQKQTWCSLEGEESACEVMKSTIIRIRDEQIQIIVAESKDLMNQVDAYLSDITDQAELYSAELETHKDRLKEQQQKLHNLMRNGHIAEKIQQKQALSEELNESLALNFKKELRKLVLISKAAKINMSLDIVKLPSSVTYITEKEVGSACYSPCFKGVDDVLIGSEDGIQCYNVSTDQLTTIDDVRKGVTSVVSHNQKLYTIHNAKSGDDVVSVCRIEDMTRPIILFQFSRTFNLATYLAVSDQYVVATNPDTSELMIHNNQNKLTERKRICVVPFSLRFGIDNCLLVSGNSKLIKYSMKDGELSVVWQCEDIDGLTHIDTDSDGLIYAYISAENGGSIYIVSPDGEELSRINNAKLPATCGQMSIKDDMLLITGWEDEKLYIFKINR